MRLLEWNSLIMFDIVFVFFLFLVGVTCLVYYLPGRKVGGHPHQSGPEAAELGGDYPYQRLQHYQQQQVVAERPSPLQCYVTVAGAAKAVTKGGPVDHVTMRKGRNIQGSQVLDTPSLGDLLIARPSGLTEPEFWAVLYQAVQALQDLFLSDGAFVESTLPLVTPTSLELSKRGRVRLQQSPYLTVPPLQYTGYLAPEYHSDRNFTDTEAEKMWIHALGETLKRATLTSHGATSRLSRELCQILADMTRAQVEYRASLMHLLDVISEYCKRRQQTRPFSHIVMDLHQEALGSREASSDSLAPTWGPPAMPELRPLTRSSSGDNSTTTTPRRWHLSPTKATPRLTREASTSMEDLTSAMPSYHCHLPGNVMRPKSLCVPDMMRDTKDKWLSSGGYVCKGGGYNRSEDYSDGMDRIGAEYGFGGDRVYGVIREEVAGYEGVGQTGDKEDKVPPAPPPNSSVSSNKPTSSSSTLRSESSRYRNGNPVQRAASRLYRANASSPTRTIPPSTVDDDSHYVTMSGNVAGASVQPRDCVGPEFVVRATLPSKEIVVHTGKSGGKKTLVQVIMLNGQKLDVLCNVNSITSGQLFEHIIQKEHIEENFMLGLSTLIAGDFVFLPSDTRLSKALPSNSPTSPPAVALTLFLRLRFFLPSLRGIRGFQARHLLYLQLRRSILEHQLPCNMEQLVDLNSYALQAEFGDFNEKEHGTRDYFLLEHYVPETMSAMTFSDNESLRNELTRAHKYKKGLDVDKAEEDFIQLAQTLPHYGGHFYTATWPLKDGSQKDVWLYVSAQGINIYERSSMSTSCGPILYENFQWRAIRTLCYSKHYLCILPHNVKKETSKLKKYKLKMNHKKSYFTFRLASLHHQFFLRLRTEFTSLQSLSQQFGVPLKDIKNETNSLYKLEALKKPADAFNDASVNANTEFKIEFRPSSTISNDEEIDTRCKRSKSENDFMLLQEQENVNEDYQNKENESPYCKMDLSRSKTGLMLDSSCLSGLGNQNLSSDKRRGVKMGISAFSGSGQRICRSMEAVNIATSEELEQMSLESVSIHCSDASLPKSNEIGDKEKRPEAYILESSAKSNENEFLPDFHESLSDTLLEKLNNMSFAEERALRSVILRKDSKGSLGMQITEGSNGKIYIQSVIPGGPADLTGCIFSGDQIIGVNGQNLLCYKYNDALILLKNTQHQVEFTISQTMMKKLPKLRSPTNMTSLKGRLNLEHINESPIQPLNRDHNKLPSVPQETTQLEKYLTENCYDQTNFQKHIEPFEVPYHKHIRYEIEPCLNKSISKSCSQISGKLQLSKSIRNPNLQMELPLVMSRDKYRFQSLGRKLSDKVQLHDNGGIPPIALPRSLGLSRKWRGNVKYPVTPVKKAFTTAVEKDGNTYSSLSDEEQVFI